MVIIEMSVCDYDHNLLTRNGVVIYAVIGIALSAGAHKSAIVADPILNPGEPNTPAKKRQMQREAMSFENPEPSVKSAKIGILTR